MSILDQVQTDTKEAMKAGERERVGALRMIVNVLQQDAKLGKGDEIEVLERERKKRLEAAEAFRGGGRPEQAEAEDEEAKLIESYLPEQLGDAELDRLAAAAIEESGAQDAKEMGTVMGALMPKVKGRADGKRVSEAVRKRLGA